MVAKSISIPEKPDASDSPRETSGAESPSLSPGDAASFLPAKGERALSIGQTGSGKTTFNRWLLERLPDSPVIIYDTKHDPKFEQLPNARIATSTAAIDEALDDLSIDYVVVRPPPHINSEPRALDAILAWHEEHWRGIDAYIDEMYHFNKNGQAGPGLNGLYTRGRSRGITTIASTQRPAWISKFVFSETQLFYVFFLAIKEDLKRVADFIPGYDRLETPADHHFHLFRQGARQVPRLMPPVPVAKDEDLGYTDHRHHAEAADSDETGETKTPPLNVWI